MILGDTIAAIATAPGRGGVAVIRVSGSESFSIAERLTGIRDQGSGIRVGRIANVDEGVVLFFKGPHSYTGEDVVEFQCHGGAVTPRRVLEACLAAGARLARRGEFTERAFLNGKLDYDQAESVLDLIDAKTVRAADAALEGLAGRRRRELTALYERALDLSARLEHALDVDEGELSSGFAEDLRSQISDLRFQIAAAIRKATEGRILRTGALVVLAGPPNAGKSSLMNALLEENRAIVSDVPGTTRDSIEEWLDLGGWPIRLVDTAGLRATADEVEGEGVKRAEELVSKADVVVALTASDCGDRNVAAPTGNGFGKGAATFLSPQTLHIHSKCDLGRGEGLNVSAKTGEGLGELKRAIVAKLEELADSIGETEAVGADVGALHEVLTLLETGAGHETRDGRREADLVLLANGVRAAAERLGAAVGATYSSDLLDNLFSRFCVGK